MTLRFHRLLIVDDDPEIRDLPQPGGVAYSEDDGTSYGPTLPGAEGASTAGQ